jgi:hypothetical protein
MRASHCSQNSSTSAELLGYAVGARNPLKKLGALVVNPDVVFDRFTQFYERIQFQLQEPTPVRPDKVQTDESTIIKTNTMPEAIPYKEAFPMGSPVRIADWAFLEKFRSSWKYQHKLEARADIARGQASDCRRNWVLPWWRPHV